MRKVLFIFIVLMAMALPSVSQTLKYDGPEIMSGLYCTEKDANGKNCAEVRIIANGFNIKDINVPDGGLIQEVKREVGLIKAYVACSGSSIATIYVNSNSYGSLQIPMVINRAIFAGMVYQITVTLSAPPPAQEYKITYGQGVYNLSHEKATPGTKVTFSVKRMSDMTLKYVTIGDSKNTSGAYSYNFTMPSKNVHIMANYEEVVQQKSNNTVSVPVSDKQQTATSNQTIYVKGVPIEMVYVQHGTFTMGATSEQGSDAYDDEKPAHSVTLTNDYYMGKYEVTQKLWKAVMGSNPEGMSNLVSKFFGDDLPVVRVSWNDIQEFLKKLNQLTGKNFRLPTEAEWEYAARGGTKSRGYKYSGSNDIGTVAWYDGNSGSKPHTVGTKQANELDIYDMSGNVWEWCQDWYDDYSSSSQSNPTGASSGSWHVYRGGSWDCDARRCRVSNRGYWYPDPDSRHSTLGFRLAL